MLPLVDDAIVVDLVPAQRPVQPSPQPIPAPEPPPGPEKTETDSPPPAAAAPEPATAPEPTPPPPLVRATRPSPKGIPAPAGPRPQPTPAPQPAERPATPAAAPGLPTLGGAQLSGAQTAGGSGSGSGSGGGAGGRGGGGDCDMIRRLQQALRDDPEVQAEVMRAHLIAQAQGRALLVWDGDWLRDPEQEGKGLAGVRQAMSVEIAFSPRACQAQRMRGLVLFALTDAPSGPKVAVGTGAWAWSDLVDRRR